MAVAMGEASEQKGHQRKPREKRIDRHNLFLSLSSPYLRPQLLVLGLQSLQARRKLAGHRRGHRSRRASSSKKKRKEEEKQQRAEKIKKDKKEFIRNFIFYFYEITSNCNYKVQS